ncbi:MAG: phenylalanine--tRNA ligase subunit alpha, partial [Saprospiraceae bacterium]
MSEIFAKVKQLIEEVESASPNSKEELEQFRIKYLGSKNIIKPLFGEIRNVPNEQKKEYGQLVNKAK